MKRTSLFLVSLVMAVIVITVSGCNHFDCINGSGNQISQKRTLKPFTKIETSGSMKLVLKQDSNQSVRIVADDNIQNEIKTSVHGNTLEIKLEGNFCSAGPIKVYLNAKDFEGIDASGAVDISSSGRLNVKDFALDLSGSSKVSLDLNAANLKTETSGSSEIILKGQVGSHNIDLSGSSDIEALDLVVGKYRIESSGASKARINVLNSLDVNSTGSSDIEYRGNPSHVSNNESGASSLKKVN